MREIGFRVWDIDNEIMIYSDNKNYHFQIGSDGKIHVYAIDGEDMYELHISDGMQFINLPDKNNTPIYERDIVRFIIGGYEYKSEVRFDSDCGCYVVKTFTDILFNHVKRTAEVIGNLYEHPHLLKEE